MSSDKHHRKPRSLGGKTDNYNCVRVDKNRHYFWHALFGNMSGEQIAREIQNVWLDPAFKIVRR